MVIRIFIALLVLNFAAFVVRAEASEHLFDSSSENMTIDEVYKLQQMSGDSDNETGPDAISEIGSRLLSLSLVRSSNTGKHYASYPAQADHGVGLLNDGARLNLKWNF